MTVGDRNRVLGDILSPMRDRTIEEVTPERSAFTDPETGQVVHYEEQLSIFSSRHHKGAVVYANHDAALRMRNELNRASKRTWDALHCEEHDGWHLVAGNQFFRRGQ